MPVTHTRPNTHTHIHGRIEAHKVRDALEYRQRYGIEIALTVEEFLLVASNSRGSNEKKQDVAIW